MGFNFERSVSDKTMYDMFRWSVIINPDKTAVIFGSRRLRYHELNDRVNRLANAMTQMGLRRNDGLALVSYNCSEYIEILLAAIKLGIAVVPINCLLSRDSIVQIINDSDAKALFYDEKLG